MPPILFFNIPLDECVEKVVPGDDGIGDSIVYKVVNHDLVNLVIKYLQTNVCKTHGYRPGRFPGSVPISAFKAQLPQLCDGKELHTEKIRGTRYKFVGLKLVSTSPGTFGGKSCMEPIHVVPKLSIIDVPDVYYSNRDESEDQSIELKILESNQQQNFENTIDIIGKKKKYNKSKTKKSNDEDEDDEDEESDDEECDDDDDEKQQEPICEVSKHHNVDNQDIKNQNIPHEPKKIYAIQYLNAFINRANEIFILPDVQLSESIYPCVLDGELIRHIPSQKHHYLIFNISMTNGYLYTNFSYQDRVYAYHQLVKNNISYNCDNDTRVCTFLAKPQFPWHQFDQVYKRIYNGEYDCDGMVSTFNKAQSIEMGTDMYSYKIKNLNEHTSDIILKLSETNANQVDFFVLGYVGVVGQFARTNKGTRSINLHEADKLFLLTSQTMYETFPRELVQTAINDPTTWSGYLFECLWDKNSDKFKVVLTNTIRKRRDKLHPNNARTVELIKSNIKECITPDDVLGIWKQWKLNSRDNYHNPNQFNDNSMMTSHYCNKHLHDFKTLVWDKSNWRPEKIPNNYLVHMMSSIEKLSWSKFGQSTQSSQSTTNNTTSSTSTLNTHQSNNIGLSKKQIHDLLFVQGLKPVVKGSRKYKSKSLPKKTRKRKSSADFSDVTDMTDMTDVTDMTDMVDTDVEESISDLVDIEDLNVASHMDEDQTNNINIIDQTDTNSADEDEDEDSVDDSDIDDEEEFEDVSDDNIDSAIGKYLETQTSTNNKGASPEGTETKRLSPLIEVENEDEQ